MEPLLIGLTTLSGAFLAVAFALFRKNPAPEKPDPGMEGALTALDERVHRLELKWSTTLEELQERLEKGTHAWRKVRQAEAYARRQEESEEGENGEYEDPNQGVLPFDEAGSDPRGLSYMPRDVERHSEPAWSEASKALARHLIGRP